jgi:hypothetical protein
VPGEKLKQKNLGRDCKGKKRGEETQARGGGKKKTKQTNKQKPKYRKENLQNAEKFMGFREGFFVLRGYALNCEIERKRHPRGHAIEPQAEESPGNEEITGGEERRILGQAATTTTTKNNAANLSIILDSCLRAASNRSGYV